MINSFYPVIMCKSVKTCADFFINRFNFKEIFESDWYVSLKSDSGFELAIIDSEHETIPEKYREICKGIILNIEVDDVDKIYSEIKKADIIQEIRDEDFGQRHFILKGPEKIIVDVIKVIPPSEEFLKNYK